MAQNFAPSEGIAESLFFDEIHTAPKYSLKFFNHINKFKQSPGGSALKCHQNIYIAFGTKVAPQS